MKTPTLVKLKFAEVIPNPNNHRSACEYFPRGEEERVAMGVGILAGGVQAMDPWKVSQRVKEKVVTNVVIGGNRRYFGAETIDTKQLAELSFPCLLYKGLTELEELEIELLDNEHIKPGPFSTCKIVERLHHMDKTNTEIAKRFGWSAPQVSNLLILTQIEPWARHAGESGKIAASLVWQLYNGQKGKKEEKVQTLNSILSSKRAIIESDGVTAKDFNLKETVEAKSTEIFNQCVSAKAEELAVKLIADKELAAQVKVYDAFYAVTDTAIKGLITLDKSIGEQFFAEFNAATKPLESARDLATYQAVTGTLNQLNERTGNKVKELVTAQLLAKEQSNTISQAERDQLTTLQGGKVEPKGDIASGTPDTSGLNKESNNVQGPPIDDSLSVKVTTFLGALIILCDKAIVTDKKPAGQVLDSLRATVRKECGNFLNRHKLIE